MHDATAISELIFNKLDLRTANLFDYKAVLGTLTRLFSCFTITTLVALFFCDTLKAEDSVFEHGMAPSQSQIQIENLIPVRSQPIFEETGHEMRQTPEVLLRLKNHNRWLQVLLLVSAISFCLLLYRHIRLGTHYKELRKISRTDKLTGLYNRVKTDESLNYHINSFRRYSDIFSIILLDLDDFKRINDHLGHIVGDQILVQLADVLRDSCRSTDIVGRWGGEEFLIICPKTDLEQARQITEKLIINIQKIKLAKTKRANSVQVISASFGVAEIAIEDTLHTLISRADKGMLQAKQTGKNRYVLAKVSFSDDALLTGY